VIRTQRVAYTAACGFADRQPPAEGIRECGLRRWIYWWRWTAGEIVRAVDIAASGRYRTRVFTVSGTQTFADWVIAFLAGFPTSHRDI